MHETGRSRIKCRSGGNVRMRWRRSLKHGLHCAGEFGRAVETLVRALGERARDDLLERGGGRLSPHSLIERDWLGPPLELGGGPLAPFVGRPLCRAHYLK